ncbi:MAG: transposase [Proteobacteria bacterium]|nr:transposase [Pseudomonadota bacterium]
MMGSNDKSQDEFFYSFNLEDVVPEDHLLRSIDRFLDLSDLREHLAPYYSHTGRPSIDPELMIRMLIIGYCLGIRSERRLCEEVKLNLAYRWFCRLSISDAVPDHSTFSKNRHGRFREAEAFYRWIRAAAIGDRLGWTRGVGADVKVQRLGTEDSIEFSSGNYEDGALFQKVAAKASAQLAKHEREGENLSGHTPTRLALHADGLESRGIIWDIASSSEMAEERAEFLKLVRQRKLSYARDIDYVKMIEGEVGMFQMFLGFRKVAANFVWLEVDRLWHQGTIHRMIPLMKTCVLLDPQFIDAYLLGSWHLAYNVTAKMQATPHNKKVWNEYHQACIGKKNQYYYFAVDFLRDGISHNEHDYRIYFDLGFGIYKENLTGIDDNLVACIRMLLALPLFLPFLRLTAISRPLMGRLLAIGAVQYGVMYITYNYSYQYLESYQVALFTIFTPIFVTLINDAYARRLQFFFLGTALMAVIGAAVIQYESQNFEKVITGFLLLQVSNACFAFGQVEYRRIRNQFANLRNHQVYALLYMGALLVTAISTTVTGGWDDISTIQTNQVLTLVYLGVLASGLGFFWWNKGAVLTQPGTLAVFNNVKIPLAVMVSILVFREESNLWRLLLGGGLMLLAVTLSEWHVRKTSIDPAIPKLRDSS